MLRLTITANDRVQHVPLTFGRTAIGSSRENDVVITAPGVSRRHASIERTSEGMTITDQQSRNGIFVGQRRVRSATLRPGEVVRIGAASLVVEEVPTSDFDLALRLADSSSVGGGLPGTDTDSNDVSVPDSGPVAALRWARRVEQSSPEEIVRGLVEWLQEARRIVRAEALLLMEPRRDDVVVLASSGPLPDDAEAAGLSQGGTAGWLCVGWLACRLSPASRSAWKREFLQFASACLADAFSGRPVERANLRSGASSETLRGTSTVMQALRSDIERVAAGAIDVLLSGETGSGKELVARAIHDASARAREPFIAVNCAAVAAELLEAELFGIGRGVATGVDARPGLFLAAHGGTIFLDEISEMPEALQAKMLRVLQEREVLPVGATKPRSVDVRVISSTNRDLEALMRSGAFRADLYYRIRVIEIRVPPLRARREDIGELVYLFMQSAAATSHKRIAGLTRSALRRLVAYDWPGNVRELRNTIESAVIRCQNGGAIEEVHLGLTPTRSAGPLSTPIQATRDTTLVAHVESAERDAIVSAVLQSGGNKSEAARRLGITRAGLYLKMKRYGLS